MADTVNQIGQRLVELGVPAGAMAIAANPGAAGTLGAIGTAAAPAIPIALAGGAFGAWAGSNLDNSPIMKEVISNDSKMLRNGYITDDEGNWIDLATGKKVDYDTTLENLNSLSSAPSWNPGYVDPKTGVTVYPLGDSSSPYFEPTKEQVLKDTVESTPQTQGTEALEDLNALKTAPEAPKEQSNAAEVKKAEKTIAKAVTPKVSSKAKSSSRTSSTVTTPTGSFYSGYWSNPPAVRTNIPEPKQESGFNWGSLFNDLSWLNDLLPYLAIGGLGYMAGRR